MVTTLLILALFENIKIIFLFFFSHKIYSHIHQTSFNVIIKVDLGIQNVCFILHITASLGIICRNQYHTLSNSKRTFKLKILKAKINNIISELCNLSISFIT